MLVNDCRHPLSQVERCAPVLLERILKVGKIPLQSRKVRLQPPDVQAVHSRRCNMSRPSLRDAAVLVHNAFQLLLRVQAFSSARDFH